MVTPTQRGVPHTSAPIATSTLVPPKNAMLIIVKLATPKYVASSIARSVRTSISGVPFLGANVAPKLLKRTPPVQTIAMNISKSAKRTAPAKPTLAKLVCELILVIFSPSLNSGSQTFPIRMIARTLVTVLVFAISFAVLIT